MFAKKIERGDEKRIHYLNFLCLTRPSVLCLRTNIKMRDQNPVVRGKNFKEVGELILTKKFK
jgi:hypothetical protein